MKNSVGFVPSSNDNNIYSENCPPPVTSPNDFKVFTFCLGPVDRRMIILHVLITIIFAITRRSVDTYIPISLSVVVGL